MKKFLSIVLSILMVVTMLPMAVLPASAAVTSKNSTLGITLYMDEALCSHNEQQPVDTIYTSTSLGYKEEYRLTYEYSDNDLVIEYYYGVSHAGHSADGVRTSFTVPDFSCEKTYNQKFTTANGSIVTFRRSAGHAVSSWTNNNNGTHSGICSFCGAVTVNCTYSEATCVAPKTCITCGATKGDIDATAHSWANNDGICANGCGATCAHENQTGSVCEICGEHICNYNNGFCTECDAYEPAELKDGYYQIKNGGNLFWYANYINTVDRTANAVLTADIDLENRPWTPIGSTGENSNNFRGIFDGQNYVIRGLYVEGDRAGLGFFGEVRTGTVKNFTIYGEVVVNTEVDYVGGVIGSICGVNGENDLERNGAIIQNIKSFVNLTVKAHGVGKIGGFVGYANHQSLIEHCAWYGTFDAGEYRVDNGAGGFIGRIQENSSEVTIRNCGAYGTIKTNYAGDYNDTATIYMGGFLSFSNTNAQTVLENCLFAGRFERGENLTDQAFLGAFGTLRSVNAIKNCYYLGDDGLEAVHSDSNLKPGSDNVEITKVTGEGLKSGEIAYKLQEANEIWGQSIGTDAYPVLGGEEVYCGYTACDDEAMVYTNDSTVSDTKPEHSIDANSVVDNGDGTHSFTCGDCGATVSDNHDFGSGNTCICGAEIAFTGIVVDDENSDEYRYDETRKTYTIIIPADEVGGIGYLSYDIIGTNLTLIEDTNTLLKVQHENEDGLTPAPDDLLVDVLQDNGCFGWSVLGYGDGEWEKLLYSNDGGMTWTIYTFEVKQAYSITVNASQNGTVTANEYAIEGDNIALNVSPAEGYMLDTLSVTDASGNSVDVENNAFTMPASAVTVTATFAVCDHKDGRRETATDNGDGTHDATCSVCGKMVDNEAHVGGKATCKEQAICDLCGASYGEFDWTNHEGEYVTVWFNDYQHVSEYECCHIESSVVYEDHDYKDYTITTPADCVNNAWETGKCICGGIHTREIAGSAKNHDWSDKNGICANCGEECAHEKYTDGVCDKCGYECPHDSYTYTDNGDGTHDKVCLVCDYVEVDNEAHTGGTATCTAKAVCDICGESYGEVDKNNHDETVAYVNGFCPNCDAYEPAELVDGVYQISNAGNLYWFADKVTNENATYGSVDAILTCDIRVNEGTMTEASTGARVWTPIGKLAFGVRCPYTGTFEGNGKTVSGLYFNDTSANFSVGLFSLVGEGGKVQNVGIADSYFCGGNNVGAVAGSNYGTVTGCYNIGIISGSGNSVGGVVGSNRGTVTGCYNTGTVSGTTDVGGVVGNNTVNNGGVYYNSIVTDCHNSGTVSGTNNVGGVAGSGGSSTQGCYNTGTVSGTNNVGGVAGDCIGEVILVGCYNSGTVSGTTDVGGVVGFTNATVTNCYFDSTVYTGDAIGNNYGTATDVEGKSTEQFKSGEVAYLLSQGENGSIWGQTIGTDPAPVFSDAKVYYGYTSCGDTVAKYTNDETISAEKPDHTQKPTYTDNGNGTHSAVYPCCGTTVTEEHDFENDAHQCVCGYACPHDSYTDGVCDKCGYECAHTWDEDGYCRKCKTFCKHENNVNGVCTVCDCVLTFSVITGDTVSYYDSFDDALENAEEGSTVKLMKGIEQIASYEINKAITFDLNGNSWDTGSSDYIDVYTFVTFTDSVGTGSLNLSLNLYAPCLFNSGTYKGIGIMFETEDTLGDYLAECHGFFDHYTGEFKDVSDEKYVMGAKVDIYHKLGAQTCKGYQCEVCGEYFGEADPDAHDWSNKDGICAICAYECPHEWGEGVLTRPTFESEGYYTYTCTLCGHSYTEPAEEADTTALNDASMKVTEYIDNDTLTQEAANEIHNSYLDILKNNGNVFDGFGFVRGDLVEEDQPAINAVTAELEKIIADADEKIASGEYVKADYTEIDEAIDDIEEKLASENVTDEGKAELEEIKKQLEEMKADENTSEADLAELEKELEAYEEELDKGIEDGTLVEVDVDAIADDVNKKWAEKLEAEGLLDEYEDFINNQKATDEAMATLDEINDFANSLEGTVAENAENIAKLNEMLNSFTASFENCLRGTHNFGDYEVTSPAKCEVNAIETSTCWFCGETDEREIEGTALTHSFTKYEETEAPKCGVAGKEVAYCDNGCQTTDERETPALEHIFLDYVSNGDATCTADGTKTASCIHGCGATDTVADEGSMIDHSDEDGDKLCDDCGEEVYDRCDICGGKAHGDDKIQLLFCMIITIIRFVTSILKSIN